MDFIILVYLFIFGAFVFFAGAGIYAVLTGKITWDEFWHK